MGNELTMMSDQHSNEGPRVSVHHMNPFPAGAQSHLYQDKVDQISRLTARVEVLEKYVSDRDKEIASLRQSIMQDKHNHQLELIKERDAFKDERNELKAEIKDLQKELEESNANKGLNGLLSKAVESENGIQGLAEGFATIMDSINRYKSGAAGEQQKVVSTSMYVNRTLEVLNRATPAQQEAVFNLLMAIGNASNADQSITPETIILSFINQLQNGMGSKSGTDS